MAKVNFLLTQRFKQATQKLSKMATLAQQTSEGTLSSFSGVFRITPLTAQEHAALQNILSTHLMEGADLQKDLHLLSAITTEVRAINNQATILHGERIKKAQEVLKKYRDGAFSAWLITTYGNRQTPYNFLQYYELHSALPQMLHSTLEEMPRQVVYALASRTGSYESKEKIIKNYKGEPKQELLALIRQTFPLAKEDRRAQDAPELVISSLTKLERLLDQPHFKPSSAQKQIIEELLKSLLARI